MNPRIGGVSAGVANGRPMGGIAVVGTRFSGGFWKRARSPRAPSPLPLPENAGDCGAFPARPGGGETVTAGIRIRGDVKRSLGLVPYHAVNRLPRTPPPKRGLQSKATLQLMPPAGQEYPGSSNAAKSRVRT